MLVRQDVTRNRPAAGGRSPLRAYLAEFSAACERAMAQPATIVRDLRLGDRIVRVRCSSAALADAMLPAVSHLRIEGSARAPDLRIDLWEAAGGVGLPPAFTDRGTTAPARGEVRSDHDAGVYAVFQSGVHPGNGSLAAATLYDRHAGVARCFVLTPDQIPWYERAAPFRTVLQWALSGPHRLLIHAGAVGVDGSAVLLTGRSGSGKSTTAVAAALAGLDFLGDDYVLLDTDGPTPVAHSLYATAKLHPSATALLERLPPGLRATLPADVKKHVVDVAALPDGRLRREARIAAVVVPRVRPGGGTRLARASAASALLAIGPTTVLQAPWNDGGGFEQLGGLVRSVPAYTLDLDGPGQIRDVLTGLLRDLGP